MYLKKRSRVRNAMMARNSFVTRRAETKISALADLFKIAAGERWIQTESGVLTRKLFFSGFHYLDSLKLVYNWENRFLSVNYNLQMISTFPTDSVKYQEPGDSFFTLDCEQSGLRSKRNYIWRCQKWESSEEKLNEYFERLNNPLILDRLNTLDIMEMNIHHKEGWDHWIISCESIIGSATWILIPPVHSMITPKIEECTRFLELYDLLGDAIVNNK